jgi:hypothetical protein
MQKNQVSVLNYLLPQDFKKSSEWNEAICSAIALSGQYAFQKVCDCLSDPHVLL